MTSGRGWSAGCGRGGVLFCGWSFNIFIRLLLGTKLDKYIAYSVLKYLLKGRLLYINGVRDFGEVVEVVCIPLTSWHGFSRECRVGAF